MGGLCYCYKVCRPGVIACALGKKVEGVGTTACLEYLLGKGTGELVPQGACDIATNVSGSPGKGNVLGIFAWTKGRGSWCHGVPAILLSTFRVAVGKGTCLEYLLRKRDRGVGAKGCLRYCYQRLRSPGKGNMLVILLWKKGRGSWCHRVPAILLPTFRGALGRGTCLEYLLGKRDGGVGAMGCLRYCYERFGEP